MFKVEVIVSKYDAASDSTIGQIFRAELSVCAQNCDSVLAVMTDDCKPGQCVVVRPTWNDRFDDYGYCYHEYRSFDGKPFEKIEFKGEVYEDLADGALLEY